MLKGLSAQHERAGFFLEFMKEYENGRYGHLMDS